MRFLVILFLMQLCSQTSASTQHSIFSEKTTALTIASAVGTIVTLKNLTKRFFEPEHHKTKPTSTNMKILKSSIFGLSSGYLSYSIIRLYLNKDYQVSSYSLPGTLLIMATSYLS